MDKPNVEKIVIEWLTELDGQTWPVYGDMPAPRPNHFILVDRTGGPREAMVMDAAEILIEIYHADSREACSDKANIIADSVPGLKIYESITRAKVNSVVKLDDTLAQFHRYQVYCDVSNRR